jgi:outer membrane biosynthesis protein TonB
VRPGQSLVREVTHRASGPPLLYQAALDALKKWKYEPTYLNDQPIAVKMIVTITFVLGQ